MAREPAHVQELRRALGRLLAEHRHAIRWSQATLAHKLNYHPSAISHLEAGRHPAPRTFWTRADEILHAGGALLTGYDALTSARQDATATTPKPPDRAAALPETPPPSPGGTPRRQAALHLSMAAAIAPEMLHRVLSDAATEAMEFTRLTGISSVGRGTLDHLELVLTDLTRSYSHQPPAEQFLIARTYRSRVDELIRARHTLTELRELYVYAGCLSELLAWLAHDLGNPRTAQAYATDSYTHADHAGHTELAGWATDAMTAIATYAQRPDAAVRAAMKGIAQVRIDHPLAIQLRVKAARAYARLGDREKFDTLYTEARYLHDRLPAQTPSRFTLDTGSLASYAITAYPAHAYLCLGDFHAAKAHSEAALAAHESAPPGSSSPGKGAMARLNLATALVHLGAPDEAVALGTQALNSAYAATFIRVHARDLNAVLTSRYPNLPCVRDFHEQYRTTLLHP